MTLIPIVIALGTIPKGLVKGIEYLEIREQVENIQTSALLRSARILRRVLDTWGDLLSLKLAWKNPHNNKNNKCRNDMKNKPFLKVNILNLEKYLYIIHTDHIIQANNPDTIIKELKKTWKFIS